MRVGLKLQLIHCHLCNLAVYHMFAYIYIYYIRRESFLIIRYIDVICRMSDFFNIHFLRMKKPSIYQAETIVNFVGRMCIERSHGLRIRDVIARRTRSISTIDRTCNWRRRFLWNPIFICLSVLQVQFSWNDWWIVSESLTIGQRHFPGFWEHHCGHIDSVLMPLLFRTSTCTASLV